MILSAFLIRLASILGVLLVWHLLAVLLRSAALPTPGEAMLAFGQQVPAELWKHFLISAWRVLASVFISLLLGAPLASGWGRKKNLTAFLLL